MPVIHYICALDDRSMSIATQTVRHDTKLADLLEQLRGSAKPCFGIRRDAQLFMLVGDSWSNEIAGTDKLSLSLSLSSSSSSSFSLLTTPASSCALGPGPNPRHLLP